MELRDLLGKTCVLGLSYFDEKGAVLKRSQLCGTVVGAHLDEGITLALGASAGSSTNLLSDAKQSQGVNFNLPPNLAPWFSAPPGRYRDSASGAGVDNPDYLVAWDVHRKKAAKADGEHQWWEWLPRTAKPEIGENHTD